MVNTKRWLDDMSGIIPRTDDYGLFTDKEDPSSVLTNVESKPDINQLGEFYVWIGFKDIAGINNETWSATPLFSENILIYPNIPPNGVVHSSYGNIILTPI